jgi:hypothetical protein
MYLEAVITTWSEKWHGSVRNSHVYTEVLWLDPLTPDSVKAPFPQSSREDEGGKCTNKGSRVYSVSLPRRARLNGKYAQRFHAERASCAAQTHRRSITWCFIITATLPRAQFSRTSISTTGQAAQSMDSRPYQRATSLFRIHKGISQAAPFKGPSMNLPLSSRTFSERESLRGLG